MLTIGTKDARRPAVRGLKVDVSEFVHRFCGSNVDNLDHRIHAVGQHLGIVQRVESYGRDGAFVHVCCVISKERKQKH